MTRIIIIALLILLMALVTEGVPGDYNQGGCWLAPRKMGFTASMGTASHSAYSIGNVGSALLAVNFYTVIQVDTSNVVYTRGMGDAENGYYDPDSSGCDSTHGLYLDGFVQQDIQVAAFFLGIAKQEVLITVEQALRYNTTMADSGFEYGFLTTDTLFTDNFDATRDTCVIAAVSNQGDAGRLIDDSFELIAPIFRFKVENIADPDALLQVNFEIYARHTEEVSSGGTSRLIREVENKAKTPRGRGGLQ